jgi:alpha-L-fucosidase 2
MPLGNGDIVLNVWTEASGDVVFYLSKTDAWDENARLLTLGRVRVSLNPNPFAEAAQFCQGMDLAEACLHIEGTGRAGTTTFRIWADANRPVVRVALGGGGRT